MRRALDRMIIHWEQRGVGVSDPSSDHNALRIIRAVKCLKHMRTSLTQSQKEFFKKIKTEMMSNPSVRGKEQLSQDFDFLISEGAKSTLQIRAAPQHPTAAAESSDVQKDTEGLPVFDPGSLSGVYEGAMLPTESLMLRDQGEKFQSWIQYETRLFFDEGRGQREKVLEIISQLIMNHVTAGHSWAEFEVTMDKWLGERARDDDTGNPKGLDQETRYAIKQKIVELRRDGTSGLAASLGPQVKLQPQGRRLNWDHLDKTRSIKSDGVEYPRKAYPYEGLPENWLRILPYRNKSAPYQSPGGKWIVALTEYEYKKLFTPVPSVAASKPVAVGKTPSAKGWATLPAASAFNGQTRREFKQQYLPVGWDSKLSYRLGGKSSFFPGADGASVIALTEPEYDMLFPRDTSVERGNWDNFTSVRDGPGGEKRRECQTALLPQTWKSKLSFKLGSVYPVNGKDTIALSKEQYECLFVAAALPSASPIGTAGLSSNQLGKGLVSSSTVKCPAYSYNPGIKLQSLLFRDAKAAIRGDDSKYSTTHKLWGSIVGRIKPFSVRRVPRTVINDSSTRLDGDDKFVQFYREGETDYTQVFGNFSHCPNGVTVDFPGMGPLRFGNTEALFQALKIQFLLNRGFPVPDPGKIIKDLQKANGDGAWDINKKSIKPLFSKSNVGSEWGPVSFQIMMEICKAKFTQNPDMAAALVSQRGKLMVEHSGDKPGSWSVSRSGPHPHGKGMDPSEPPTGKNWLGGVMMELYEDPDVIRAARDSKIKPGQFNRKWGLVL
jgi:hypothetical protein